MILKLLKLPQMLLLLIRKLNVSLMRYFSFVSDVQPSGAQWCEVYSEVSLSESKALV